MLLQESIIFERFEKRSSMDAEDRRIVTIGGGSGQFVLLSGLRDLEDTRITAVVSMVDSGGSTGRLRDELGILPPGDILKCILALSPYQNACRSILLKRFKKDRRLKGHSAGFLFFFQSIKILQALSVKHPRMSCGMGSIGL